MTTPATPSNSQPGEGRNLAAEDAAAALRTSDDELGQFWGKYRTLIIGVCLLVLAAILGKGLWDYIARKNDLGIQEKYAAATTPEQVKAFAAAHPDHPLGGIAHLRAADEAYAAGRTAEAATAYEKAIEILKEGPLAARARLGRTLTKAQAGQAAAAVTELQQIADDANQFTAVRAEAIYHLASLAADAANAADLQKYAAQLLQVSPESPWNMRVMGLQANLPPPAAPAISAPAPAAPAAGEKKDDTAPSIQLNLPGKK